METEKKVKIIFPKTGEECEVDYDDTLVDATFRYDLPDSLSLRKGGLHDMPG